MPKSIVPQPDKKLYPNRAGDVGLNSLPGDNAIEGYFSNTILLTHNLETNAPEIHLIAKRVNDRPNINEDGSIIIVSAGNNIDEEFDYAVKGISDYTPESGKTKTIALNTDNIRTNSRKKTFISSQDDVIISSNKRIILESQRGIEIKVKGDIKITLDGTFNLDSNKIELGNGVLKKLITESFISLFNGHVHGNGNSGNPTSPPMVPLNNSILTTKTKAS